MLFHDPMNLFTVQGHMVPLSQNRSNSPRAIFGEFLDNLADFIDEPHIEVLGMLFVAAFLVIHRGAIEVEHVADLSNARPNPVFHELALQG
jgi:hypothetical protein